MLENIVIEEEIESLKKYLDSIIGQKLFNDDQGKLSDLILKELITLPTTNDYRSKKLKPSTIETLIRHQLELPYAVSKPKKETKGENRNKRYIVISKIS
jgi:hypothetical protein